MSIRGPVRQVTRPVAWRAPRTFSSIEDFPKPGWEHTAAEWHRTHKAPPRTYPRWPVWEGLEQAYEASVAANVPQFPHPEQHLPRFPRYAPTNLPPEHSPYLPVSHAYPQADAINQRIFGDRMSIGEALATPAAMPHTFPRPEQAAVPVMAPASNPNAPQVAGYQIVGDASSPPAEGVSLGMVLLALAAGLGVGYFAALGTAKS
jgi:hypothetical protein